jgi:hypothetical protein
MVVRLDEGKNAVRAYVSEQASQGLNHVRALVRLDFDTVVGLIEDLSENEGRMRPAPDEWAISHVLAHLNASLPRSRDRLTTMSSGKEWMNQPVLPGNQPEGRQPSFVELRQTYVDGMQTILQVLDNADQYEGSDLLAEHRDYGPFSWLEWAVYSHHVHAHDHIGQLEEIRRAIPGGA